MKNKKDNFWFFEKDLPHSVNDVEIRIFVNKLLHEEKSQYNHIQVLKTPFFGRMLILDNIIQTTENDEFIYHEMMVTLPSIRIGKPRNILIIGGGDGGAIRQALRIKNVKKIVQVEIDERVVEVSKKFLHTISQGSFDDPKVELLYVDGLEYIKSHEKEFDLIVLDLTDAIPDSPAEKLFEEEFFQNVKTALTTKGIMTTHCGSLLFQSEWAVKLYKRLQTVFPWVELHTAAIPSYQLGPFGFIYASPFQFSKMKGAQVRKNFQNIVGQNDYIMPETYYGSAFSPPYLAKHFPSLPQTTMKTKKLS